MHYNYFAPAQPGSSLLAAVKATRSCIVISFGKMIPNIANISEKRISEVKSKIIRNVLVSCLLVLSSTGFNFDLASVAVVEEAKQNRFLDNY